MISRFFIERPVLANVIALLMVLIGAISILYLPVSQYPHITPPTVQVTTRYPGRQCADRHRHRGAADREQVNGVENMLYMQSTSADDGTYTLTVTFAVGTDLDEAQVQVQNRVSAALASLPAGRPVAGRRSPRRSRTAILQIVTLTSPDGSDSLFLSNYAAISLVNPGPSPGSRRRQRIRHRPIQHAGLARSEPAEGPRPHAGRRDQRDPAAEPGGGGGPDRLPARAVRAGVPVHPRPARPLHGSRPVRANHRQGRDRQRRRHHADPRRRTRRARRPDLQPVHDHERQARRRHRHLPASRRQRPGGRRAVETRWPRSAEELPAGDRLDDSLRHDALRAGVAAARSTSPWSRRPSWS